VARYIIVFINRYIMILFLKMLMGHYVTEGTAVSEIVVFPSKSKLTHFCLLIVLFTCSVKKWKREITETCFFT